MDIETSEGRLWYRDLLVAVVTDLFASDGIFHGRVKLAIDRAEGDVQRRLLEFIDFSMAWNRRVEECPDTALDASEHRSYTDLTGLEKWRITSGPKTYPMLDAPVFFGADELAGTWPDHEG